MDLHDVQPQSCWIPLAFAMSLRWWVLLSISGLIELRDSLVIEFSLIVVHFYIIFIGCSGGSGICPCKKDQQRYDNQRPPNVTRPGWPDKFGIHISNI